MFCHRVSNLTKLMQEFHRATIGRPIESEEYKKMSREMPVVFAALVLLFLFSSSFDYSIQRLRLTFRYFARGIWIFPLSMQKADYTWYCNNSDENTRENKSCYRWTRLRAVTFNYVHVRCHLLILRTPFTHQFPWGRYSWSLLLFLHKNFLKTVQFMV